MPHYSIISELYEPNERKIAQKIIDEFILDKIVPLLSEGKKPRNFVGIENNEIYKIKNEIANQPHFIEMDDALSKWRLPRMVLLEEVFGTNAQYVAKNFKAFNDLDRERKCFLPYTKHLLRVAFMVKAVGFDLNSNMPANFFGTLWALHDSDEELPFSVKDSNGEVYGLRRLPEYNRDYIPEIMIAAVLQVTNKSDLILNALDAKDYSLKTREGLEKGLTFIYKEGEYYFIKPDVEEMLTILANSKINSGRNSFYKDIKWEFYDKKFIRNLAMRAYADNNFSLLEGKGYDLFDNCVGRDSQDLDGRVKSIQKLGLLEAYGEENVRRGKLEGRDYRFFENKLVQFMNYAKYAAVDLGTDSIKEPLVHLDHLRSALICAGKLIDVHYTRENAL